MNVNFDSTVFVEEAIHEILFTLVLAAAAHRRRVLAVPGLLVVDFNVLLAIPTSILGHVHRHVLPRVHPQHVHRARAEPGRRHRRGRRHHGAREHRTGTASTGKGKHQGRAVGAREITFAALAATAAIVAIFLPVAFMKGIDRQVLLPVRRDHLGRGAALAARGADPDADALLAVPGGRRAARAGSAPRSTSGSTRVAARYEHALLPALHHRLWVLAGSFAFFVLSVLLIVTQLRKEFVPIQDTNMFMARIRPRWARASTPPTVPSRRRRRS